MGIKRKEIDILLKLNRASFTVRELSDSIEDSERNLRYSLENLEYYLEKILNRGIDKKNKKLSVSLSKQEIDSFLYYIHTGNYIYNSKEREEYILSVFLFKDNPKLKDISEILEVSRTTLKKDIGSLEKLLEKYELYFKQEGNRVKLTGNEKKLRELMMYKVGEYLKIKESQYPVENMIKKIIEKEWLSEEDKIKKILLDIEVKLRYKFSEEFIKIMTHYLWVTFYRVKEEMYILKKANADFLRNTKQHKVIKKELEKYIPAHLEFEFLHLTEYFLSGSSHKEYYEERVAIELFTYDLLKKTGEFLEEKLYNEDLFNEIVGYLTSAIYRMKNNFVLRSQSEFPIRKDIYETLHKICITDTYLSEKLRNEEIYYISEFIEKDMKKNATKVMDMNVILKILRRHSSELDEDSLRKELLRTYGVYIDNSKSAKKMLELSDCIKVVKIKGTSTENFLENLLEEWSKKLLEDGVIRKKISFSGYTETSILNPPKAICYHINDFSLVEKNAIYLLHYEEDQNKVKPIILLALREDKLYLEALFQLKDLLETKVNLEEIRDVLP